MVIDPAIGEHQLCTLNTLWETYTLCTNAPNVSKPTVLMFPGTAIGGRALLRVR